MAGGVIKKLLGAGLDAVLAKKKQRGPSESTVAKQTAEERARDEEELLMLERQLVKQKNPETIQDIKGRIYSIKARLGEFKPKTPAEMPVIKDYAKPMKGKGTSKMTQPSGSARRDRSASGKTRQAEDMQLPDSLKPQAGVLDSEVDANKTGTPAIFKKQAM